MGDLKTWTDKFSRLSKSIQQHHVDAAVSQYFNFWADPDNGGLKGDYYNKVYGDLRAVLVYQMMEHEQRIEREAQARASIVAEWLEKECRDIISYPENEDTDNRRKAFDEFLEELRVG